jgi:ABC-type phosphate transport system auxiliary subunit
LIQTASEKALMICRELERVELKRKGLELAGQIDSSTKDALKKQIEDLDKNIGEATAAYGDLITQLVGLRSDVVDNQFEHYTQWLTKKESFVQIPKTRMMKHHYDRYRGGERGIDINKMGKDCTQTLTKGT